MSACRTHAFLERQSMRPKVERLLKLITDDWLTARELAELYLKEEGAKKTALNSYQIGTLSRGLIARGLIEFQWSTVRINGSTRRVRKYRRRKRLTITKEIEGQFVAVGCKKCDTPLKPVTKPKKVCLTSGQEFMCGKCGYTIIVSTTKFIA